ncbi:hypothetical protein RINGS_8 [Arthrobacter phage Rings]|uniref:Uncharacterized protein n=1 Tax=Arthrobacter phage Rings TaxID=1772313 RepID=A0A0U3TM20_9CAUD|nr:hypothetical protein RINGS_8 [Arthrobacter phage Rings]
MSEDFKAQEEPEVRDSVEDEGLLHGPEEVDGEWFCRWDEEDWPCKWVEEHNE